MQSFEGYIDRIHRHADGVSARLVVGEFDPNPNFFPVVVVEVHVPEDLDALYVSLVRAKDQDDACYLAVHSNGDATLTTDHGQVITFRGMAISVIEEDYDLEDYKRLAKQNHTWGMENYMALKKQSEALYRIQSMLREQMTRVLAKSQSHPPGTTAHTLYAQQLSFMARALSDSEA